MSKPDYSIQIKFNTNPDHWIGEIKNNRYDKVPTIFSSKSFTGLMKKISNWQLEH